MEEKFWRGSCKKKFLLQKTIASEVKAIVQSNVVVDKNTGTFNLSFAGEYLDGKINLFLSKDEEFMINSFNANIDTNDLQLNDYGGDSSSIEQIDLTNDEIKYIHQNLENSRTF